MMMTRKKSRPLKEATIGVNFTPDQKEKIEQRARERDMNTSEYIRDLVRRDLEHSQNGQAA